MKKPHLLFIPGLGDRAWLYFLVRPLWRLYGYGTHVHIFGWNDSGSSLEDKEVRLLRHVGSLPRGKIYVIGMSAGGTAAINALRATDRITKVVTVASPLRPKDRPLNRQLSASIEKTDTFLNESGPVLTGQILSVHGLYDRRVPVGKSKHKSVATLLIPTIGHGLTILMAVSVFARKLRRFLM